MVRDGVGCVTAVGTFLLLAGGIGSAQATVHTHASGPQPAIVIATSTAQPANARAHIKYSEGLLEVIATNSSLNQILSEVASKTGMKLTGGVRNERVYGRYGPGTPAAVLAALLAGTECNMLLVEGISSAPKELILTLRSGGSAPPPPPMMVFASAADLPRSDSSASFNAGASTSPTIAEGTGVGGSAGAPDAPPVMTPQQLYDRSIQLQSQQRQATER